MRRASIVLATSLVISGFAATGAAAIEPDEVPAAAADATRVAGADRYETAAETARATYPDGVDTVVLTTGRNYPDALAGAYLAGLQDAPILLTGPTAIPTATLDVMTELDVEQVVILGRANAVSAEIEDGLGEQGYAVTRIGGEDRFSTAAQIFQFGEGTVGEAPNLSDEGGDALPTAIVASGREFADALASGPLSVANNHPILLTEQGELPTTTQFALESGQIGQVIIAGGTNAVSAEVEATIAGLDTIESVTRVGGADRTETAALISEVTRAALGWDADQVTLARGDDFPDSLTVAPLAASNEGSLLLARSFRTLQAPTFEALQGLAPETSTITVTGGTNALAEDVVADARLATVPATITAELSGAAEVPGPGDEDASGTTWVFVEGDTVCTVIDAEDIEPATAAHIHEKADGEETGDPVITLETPDANGWSTSCADDAEVAAGLTTTPGDYYVNVHNEEFPNGASRADLGDDDGPVSFDRDVTLTGDAEVDADGADVPDDGSGIEGTATVSFDFTDPTAPVVCVRDLSIEGLDDGDAIAAMHIHEAPADEAGPVVVPFEVADDAGTTIDETCVTGSVDGDVTPTQLAEIAESGEDYYLNVHTDVYADGAARGQLG